MLCLSMETKPEIKLNPRFEATLMANWFAEPNDWEWNKMRESLPPETTKQLDHLMEVVYKLGQRAIDSKELNPKGKEAGVAVIANEKLKIKPTLLIIGDQNADIEDEKYGKQIVKYMLYALGKLGFVTKTPWTDSGANTPELVDEAWQVDGDPIPAGAIYDESSGWAVATSTFPPKVDEALSLVILETEKIITPAKALAWAKRLDNIDMYYKASLLPVERANIRHPIHIKS